MAKATGISSQFRGKIGNVIGYLTRNRAGRYEQTVKSYQPVVANPQSYAQALARVPIGPVQRVCSALLPLIQRGFEGTAYGDPSKNEFLSLNLRTFRGPFMEKGSVLVPPGPMTITKGSLRSVNVHEIDSSVDVGYACFDIFYSDYRANLRKGEIARRLLNNNTWLVPGEQLTFVIVTYSAGEFQYNFESLLLDVNDNSFPQGVIAWSDIFEDRFSINCSNIPWETQIVAACCIRSQAYRENSFKRSTATLFCSTTFYLYNDETAVRNAVASYRTGEDPDDWEDDPTPEYQKIAYLCMVDLTAEMIVGDSVTIPAGTQCLGYVTKGGQMGIFYEYSSMFRKNILLDAHAEVLKWRQGIADYVPSYNPAYEPATEYSAIYGTM